MKTVELKWIEDDNHTVAKDACDTLQGLVDSGAFPDLGVKCEDDTLYITGEKEVLDRAVMKIQKAFAKYGQIMMKEAKNGTTEELRIESFDDNVQDIFNHTLAEYETFKENTKEERPNTYITTLGKFQYKFNKLKEAAAKKDKKILQNILMEIDELTESYEEVKFKPMNKLDEGKLIDSVAIMVFHQLASCGYKNAAYDIIMNNIDYINDHSNDNPSELTEKVFKRWQRQQKRKNKEYEKLNNESYEEKKRNLSKEMFGKKFLELAQTYAGVEGLDIEVAYDKLMSDNRVFELVDSTMSIEDIMDKISAGELLQ
jgi:hypothetical protein